MRRIHYWSAAGAVSLVAWSVGACSTDGAVDSTSALTDAGVGPSSDVLEEGDAAPVDDGIDLDAFGRVECGVTPCVTALAARGGAHVCALLSDRTVRCWGANADGQLGRGPSEDAGADAGAALPSSGRPLPVVGVDEVTQLSVTGRERMGTSCARREDGAVMCWGGNRHGELGLSADRPIIDAEPHPVPSAVRGLGPVGRVDLGGSFACATTLSEPAPAGESSSADSGAREAGGRMYCWGWNNAFQLGRGELPQKHAVAGETALDFRRVRVGAGTLRNGFAIRDNGELLSWGGALSTRSSATASTELDALGRASSFDADGQPMPIPRLTEVRSISAGDTFACAVSAGAAYCWGRSKVGALGNGTGQEEPTPFAVALPTARRIVQIATSNETTCALTIDREVHCWGANTEGQLGNGTDQRQLYPVQVSALSGRDVVQVAAMDAATCALLRDGSVVCWGSNIDGQLGIGGVDDLPHYAPQPVMF